MNYLGGFIALVSLGGPRPSMINSLGKNSGKFADKAVKDAVITSCSHRWREHTGAC